MKHLTAGLVIVAVCLLCIDMCYRNLLGLQEEQMGQIGSPGATQTCDGSGASQEVWCVYGPETYAEHVRDIARKQKVEDQQALTHALNVMFNCNWWRHDVRFGHGLMHDTKPCPIVRL